MNTKRWLVVLGLFTLLSLTVGLYKHNQVQAQGNTCTVIHDKTASPTKVTEGGIVDVTLTVRATGCDATTSPVDVMLVLDRSGSMRSSKIVAAKQAAIDFVNQMGANDQVGIVSFNQNASLDQQLTADKNSAIAAIDQLGAGGNTDIADGIVTAETELNSNRHRNNNAPVMIVLSDGRHNNGANLLQTATTVKNSGIEIITIGLGSNADEQQLRKVASSDNLYRYAPNASDLANIYQSILQTSLRWAARNMVITDQLSDKVTLIPNSFSGPVAPTVNNNQLTWDVGTVPTDTISLSYKVAMTKDPGTWPTNASATGDYENSSGSSATITFPVPEVEVEAACGLPDLTDINPNWACISKSQDITLVGGGFSSVSASIGNQSLSIVSEQQPQIEAQLSAGLALGKYDVTVTNQCPAGPQTDTLTQAFTIYPEPKILSVRPSEGNQAIPNEITICGEGFAVPGTVAYVQRGGGQKIQLDNQSTFGDTCLLGTFPSGLDAGQYDVLVENSCGQVVATSSYLNILFSTNLNDDLVGNQLWVDPSMCIRENDDTKIGLNIIRRGGKNPVNVTVSFYENQIADQNKIGDGTIDLLPPRAGTALVNALAGYSTSSVDWTPTQGVGLYTLYAVIDPNNTVPEDAVDTNGNDLNNIISRTVQVLPATSPGGNTLDGVAPVLSVFEINGGNRSTYDQNVTLRLKGDDSAQQGVTPTGIAQMNIIEYLFLPSPKQWVPIATSGWITYTETYTWRMADQGGIRYLGAWVTDGQANIQRFPYLQEISYFNSGTGCEDLPMDTARTYRETLQAGDTMSILVTPCSGDPDLYVWPPDWDPKGNLPTSGRPPWVSNLGAGEEEFVTITAPVDGSYAIEVYGYAASEYDIQMDIAPSGGNPRQDEAYTAGIDPNKPIRTRLARQDKTERTAPFLPPGFIPATSMGIIPPVVVPTSDSTTYIYLPAIVK